MQLHEYRAWTIQDATLPTNGVGALARMVVQLSGGDEVEAVRSCHEMADCPDLSVGNRNRYRMAAVLLAQG